MDSLFPLLSVYGDHLEDCEMELMENPTKQRNINTVRKINRELVFIRRVVRPTMKVVSKLIHPLEEKYLEDEDLKILSSSGIHLLTLSSNV